MLGNGTQTELGAAGTLAHARVSQQKLLAFGFAVKGECLSGGVLVADRLNDAVGDGFSALEGRTANQFHFEGSGVDADDLEDAVAAEGVAAAEVQEAVGGGLLEADQTAHS